MAAGRAQAMLGYGVAHFVVYATAVLVVAAARPRGRGIAAAAVVHTIFLVVAYQVLLRGRGRARRCALWDDVAPRRVAASRSRPAAAPGRVGARNADAPVLVHIAARRRWRRARATSSTLRAGFPAAWRDLGAAIRRVVPGRRDARAAAACRCPRALGCASDSA